MSDDIHKQAFWTDVWKKKDTTATQAQCWFCPKCYEENPHDPDKCKTRTELEADSELLNKLIELMRHIPVGFTCDADFKEWGVFDLDDSSGFTTGRNYSTPREAIENAVRKFMESK